MTSKSYLLTVHVSSNNDKAIAKHGHSLPTFQARQNDRPERQAAAVLVVRVPAKTSKRRLQFSSSTFTARVSESTPVNSQILKLTLAEDPEVGESFRGSNGVVSTCGFLEWCGPRLQHRKFDGYPFSDGSRKVGPFWVLVLCRP